jgi:hypothetical protein
MEGESKLQKILRLTDKLLADRSQQFETSTKSEDGLGETGDLVHDDNDQRRF